MIVERRAAKIFFQSLWCLATMVLVAEAWPSGSSAAAADMPAAKIVLVSTDPDHEHGTHMYRHECQLLAKCLNQTPGVQAVVSPEPVWPAAADAFDGVRAIVYYSRPAGDILLAPQRRDQVRRLLKSGVGLTAIHWSTASEVAVGADWNGILGGWFNFAHSGLKIDTRLLKQVSPASAICRGWEPYPLHDEFYLNLKFHPQAQPVLSVDVDGRDQVVAWTFERPDSNGGRSFGTTLGHFHENFALPAFRRMIVQGILWTAHVDVPAAGAPVDLTEQDLQLPPKK